MRFARAPGSTSVPFTVSNNGSRIVRLVRCGEQITVAVDRRELAGWSEYSGGFCLHNQVEVALTLAPGERAESAVLIAESGHYRLRIGIRGPGEQPDWSSTSNDFVIQ